MRKKICIPIFAALISAATVNSQSVYQLKYNLQNTNAPLYSAMFVRNDDGTGTMRVKYDSPGTGATLIDMDVQEEYPDMKEAADSEKLLYRLGKPKFITGNDANFKAPLVWFKKTTTGEYEPWGITTAESESVNPFSSVQFLDSNSLKKDLVLEYFTKQDVFYKNLFETRTRDLSPIEKNTKIILVVVANSNDPEIGPSCEKDKNRIVETFTKLSDFLKIKLEYKTISGPDYNKQNVEKAIETLAPKPNDIMVFYYSGHGFRKPMDNRRFPYIDLRPKPDRTYMVNSLNMEDIYNTTKKKGARLNLIISDCCNTDVEKNNAIGTPIPRKKGLLMTYSLENCRALFFDPKPTSILMTAADVGQKAASNNEFGGFFSYFFKASMENQLSFFKKNVTWESLLQDAKKQTIKKAEHTYCDKPYIPENICEQYPVWK